MINQLPFSWRTSALTKPWHSMPDVKKKVEDLPIARSTSSPATDEQTDAASAHPPPPAQFPPSRRRNCCSSRKSRPMTAIVAVESPHQILTVSNELCDFLGLTPETLCSRNIKILEGPKSSPLALKAAIKGASLQSSKTLHLTIYTCNAEAREVVVSCSPVVSEACTTDRCLLSLQSAKDWQEQQLRPSTSNDSRRQYRARYNFVTGLKINAAQRRVRCGNQA